jgi:hypothetical protein
MDMDDPNFDVVVVGGGLAGVCAALAATRQGVRVALINDRPVLGGVSSTEIRVPPSGAGDKHAWAKESGIVDELLTEERARSHDAAGYAQANTHWDLVLYDACRSEPHLTLFLNTSVREVECVSGAGESRTIAAVLATQLGTEKALRIAGQVFVDASGDGTVVEAAGLPTRYGREGREEYGESLAPELADGETLGSSLLFRARDTGRPVSFEAPSWAVQYPDEASLAYRGHQTITGGYWWIELAYPLHTIRDNDQIRDTLLAHVLGVWDHIKNHCTERAAAANYALDWVGMVPGKRESRRAVGAYVMTQSELLRREVFWDRIGYGGWHIDDHERQGISDPERRPSKAVYVAPYAVPLRTLILGPHAPNLMVAGRLMSVSRIVFLSLRVQQTLGSIGQAAGTAAALCAQRGIMPSHLGPAEVQEVQQRLLEAGSFIPALRNEDPADLARAAAVTASSEATLSLEPDQDLEAAVDLVVELGQVIPIGADRIETVQLFLENRTDAPQRVRLRVHPARDVWDLDVFATWRLPETPGVPPARPAEVLGTAEVTLPAGHAGWTAFPLGVAVSPESLVWLVADACPGVHWRLAHQTPPGTCAAHPGARVERHVTGEDWWQVPAGRKAVAYVTRGLWRSLSLRLSPASQPFGAQNVVNGVTRPERWTNAWVSDPAQPLPQWLEIDLGEAREVDTAIFTFDTNLNRTHSRTPPLWRAPECVRDYTVSVVDEAGGWREVVRETGNYQRRRVHRFPPVRTSRLRLTVQATNGAPPATVYEVRLYGEGG